MVDLKSLTQKFIELYGREPRVFRAPGRINIIGEHTDHNDGFVLPAAIDRATYVAAAEREDRSIVARSMAFEGTVEVDLDDVDAVPRNDWGRYVQGVARLLEASGHTLTGADILIASDIPLGAGLSSSAALEVSIAFALSSISGSAVVGMELATIAQTAEHLYGGVPSGIMDQFISAHGREGKALCLDCRSMEWFEVDLKGAHFVLCNTMTKHDLADGQYAKRRDECDAAAKFFGAVSLRQVSLSQFESRSAEMDDVLFRRARHVFTENVRVHSAIAALANGDMASFGNAIDMSHASLRDDFEVSCRELDAMADICRKQPGVFGSRMLGGGFGGCVISLIESDSIDAFRSAVSSSFAELTGIIPEIYDVTISSGVSELA